MVDVLRVRPPSSCHNRFYNGKPVFHFSFNVSVVIYLKDAMGFACVCVRLSTDVKYRLVGKQMLLQKLGAQLILSHIIHAK
jgi:hypothetical protein